MELKFSPSSPALHTLAHTCTLGIPAGSPSSTPSPQYGTNCLASTCHSQYITEATRPEGAQEEPKDMLTALPPLPETSVSRASPVTPIPKDPTPHTEGRLLQGRYTVPHKDFSGNLISAGRFSRACPSSRRERPSAES